MVAHQEITEKTDEELFRTMADIVIFSLFLLAPEIKIVYSKNSIIKRGAKLCVLNCFVVIWKIL